MTIKSDPSLYKSDFERNRLDRYWTEHPVTTALAQRIPFEKGNVWDPCCGRGDIAQVLKRFGHWPFMSDIDISEVCEASALGKLGIQLQQADFLQDNPDFLLESEIDGIITNTPFGDAAEDMVRHALAYKNIRFFAFLLRAEWDHASTRRDLFTEQPFAKEIVLTWRPRWDWWLTDEEKRARKIAAGKDPDINHSPRHNYSWFVWDRKHTGPATKDYAYREKE